VIDARVHHWVLERFRYPWLDDAAFEALRADYLPADCRADAAECRWTGGCTSRVREAEVRGMSARLEVGSNQQLPGRAAGRRFRRLARVGATVLSAADG